MAPQILSLCSIWRWVVSSMLERFTPWERGPCTHWIGGSVGPWAGLDAVPNRKKSHHCPLQGVKACSSSPEPSLYTDLAAPIPNILVERKTSRSVSLGNLCAHASSHGFRSDIRDSLKFILSFRYPFIWHHVHCTTHLIVPSSHCAVVWHSAINLDLWDGLPTTPEVRQPATSLPILAFYWILSI